MVPLLSRMADDALSGNKSGLSPTVVFAGYSKGSKASNSNITKKKGGGAGVL